MFSILNVIRCYSDNILTVFKDFACTLVRKDGILVRVIFKMNIFAIGDLHLSFNKKVIPGQWDLVELYKPMSLFGEKWEKHYQKIYENWWEIVSEDDLVLLPGDISWASDFVEAEHDFNFIAGLPGKKVLIRGNHDYWWQAISRLRSQVPENCYLIQNDSLNLQGVSVAGTRGWTVPNSFQFTEHDEKIYRRELVRLELSLKSIKMRGEKLIVMLHYMPVNEDHEKNEIIELLQDFQVDICIYGHLHGEEAHKTRLTGEKWGINFQLVSSDFLNFKPMKILD